MSIIHHEWLFGTHKWDLNNATIEHDGELVKNESYIYRGTEVRMTFLSQEYETLYSLKLFYKIMYPSASATPLNSPSTHQNVGYDN